MSAMDLQVPEHQREGKKFSLYFAISVALGLLIGTMVCLMHEQVPAPAAMLWMGSVPMTRSPLATAVTPQQSPPQVPQLPQLASSSPMAYAGLAKLEEENAELKWGLLHAQSQLEQMEQAESQRGYSKLNLMAVFGGLMVLALDIRKGLSLALGTPSAVPSRHPAPSMMAGSGSFTETPVRSFVKAAGWRFTAGVVTAITSMIFTGSLATAAAIVGWDLFSKSITMFLGERIWNKFDWGREGGGDSAKRSLAKAIAWRIFAACNTFFAAIVLNRGKSGAMGVAGKIAGTDSVVKTVLFFYYERAWSSVSWGKEFEAQAEAA